VLGIAGLIGSGRTEFLRAIFGLDNLDRGDVRIGTWSGGKASHMWRRGVGLVSEDRKTEGLALGLSIADNLTMPSLRNLGPAGLVIPSRQHTESQTWIDRLGIRCLSSRQPAQALSGGNQQKIAIARLLHADVDVLLLDEPTRGIDVGSKSQIYQLIDQCVSYQPGRVTAPKAVLMVSSYLPELLGVCDRIAVMCRGVLHQPKPVSERNEHEIMLQATGAGGAV
jgi:ribose transport system ATP-binding protein